MKLQELRRIIREELNYGKQLFADPDSKFISEPEQANKINLFKNPEKNTPEEEEILSQIYNHCKSKKTPIPKDTINKLIKLKHKFPSILQPNIKGNVYRGTIIPYDIITSLKFIGNINNNRKIKAKTNIPLSNIVNPSSKQYLSFTSDELTASDFAGNIDSTNQNLLKWKKFPAIISIPSNTPELLFNPDFMNVININNNLGFENETLLMSNNLNNINVNEITIYILADEFRRIKNFKLNNTKYYDYEKDKKFYEIYPEYKKLIEYLSLNFI